MKNIQLDEYKKYVELNPEIAALIRKIDNDIYLLSDMEYGGDLELLRLEYMMFEMDVQIPFTKCIVQCRDNYAGGITYPVENCPNFDTAFKEFIGQSDSNIYWLIDNNNWTEIANIDFDEAFVVVDTINMN